MLEFRYASHMVERDELVLCAPVRTPIGKFGGVLEPLSAADLGAAAARASLERAGLDADRVDQAVFGHARQAGGGPNTARQVAVRAGLPISSPAFTVNQACGSGLQAVLCAARAIWLGEADIVLAGGTESMSNTPFLLPTFRRGFRMGHQPVVDGMYRDGFDDPISELRMGETAEELAEDTGIDRVASDAWAAESQRRCEAARARGRFASEIVPVAVPAGRSARGEMREILVDEHPRDGVTAEGLAKLKPVFRANGRVTAGNASGITDGAAALIVARASVARAQGLAIAAFLRGFVAVGVEPRVMGIGPVPAVQKLLADHGLGFEDIDEIELNEAFACQVLACLRDLPFDPARVNPDGGAISLGHPIGATGARILVTLLHGLAVRDGRYGIATLCISGGLGIAALVERVSG